MLIIYWQLSIAILFCALGATLLKWQLEKQKFILKWPWFIGWLGIFIGMTSCVSAFLYVGSGRSFELVQKYCSEHQTIESCDLSNLEIELLIGGEMRVIKK